MIPVDLPPSFRTKLSMISSKERRKWHVKEQAHGSADDRGTEASGGGAKGGRRGARGGRVQAHALRCKAKYVGNKERPHGGLGYRTPKEFAAARAAGFYTAEPGTRDSNGGCYE